MVYARFINFFTAFNSSNILNSGVLKTTNFVRQAVKIKNLFKKFDYRNKLNTKGALSKLLYL